MDVTVENFEQEVIIASQQLPVLVDFWAPWCGPCKALGPILEKLADDYAGRFKLVKINSDEEQALAQAFGIRSIPTCVLLKDGKPVDGFMGALPEGKLREFLDRHVPGEDQLQSEQESAQAEALLAEGDTDAALHKLQEALAVNPANDDARFDYVKLLIGVGDLDTAQAALAPALAQIPLQLRFDALHHWLQALQFATTDEGAGLSLEQLDATLALHKRDFAARKAKAQLLMAAADWTAAMDELLEIILRDKTWNNDWARKSFVAILELLTPPRARPDPAATGKSAGGIELTAQVSAQQDPQAELVARYRRKLSMALN